MPLPHSVTVFVYTYKDYDCSRFLISAGDTPTMIRERYRYHGLLLGAFKKEYKICKALLDTITDPGFIGLLYV